VGTVVGGTGIKRSKTDWRTRGRELCNQNRMPTIYRMFESENASLDDEFTDILTKTIGTRPIIFEGVSIDVAHCIRQAHETVLSNIYNGKETHATYWEDAVSYAKEYMRGNPEDFIENGTLDSAMMSLTNVHYKMRELHMDYWGTKKILYAKHDAIWAALENRE
jgi:hypothetical protein